jgi:hypothetical protein
MLIGRLACVCAAAICLWMAGAQPALCESAPCSAAAGGGRGGDSWYACASSPSVPQSLPVLRPAPSGRSTTPGGSSAAASATTPNMSRCTYSNTDTLDGTASPAPRAGAGRWVFSYCGDSGQPGGWSWVPAAAAVVFVSPAQLAREAYARLTPPAAAPDYNPRHRAGSPDGTVVGFTTWLWLDSQSLTGNSVTAAAGPNRATVTARPSVVSFDPGDGSPAAVCAEGGRAYDPSEPNAVSDCVHRYLRSSGAAPGGVFVLTVRVTWTATWAGSGGTGGALPALTVTAATPVRVDELQAVNE